MTSRKLLSYLAAVAAIWLLMDLYAVQGIGMLAGGYAGLVLPVYRGLSAGVLLFFFYQLLKFLGGHRSGRYFSAALNAFLALLITRLVFLAVLFVEDLYRVLAAIWSDYPDRSPMFSRVALATAALPLTAFLFGITRGKYHYRVRPVVLGFDDLPAAFDGFRIAQISDIHAGSFDDPGEVRRGVDLLNRQRPDLFVFTGDLVNNHAEEIRPYLDIFGSIEAPFGKFSVLGNHDYGDYIRWPDQETKNRNLQQLKTYHDTMGFRLLLDSSAVIRKGDDQLVILGVENWGTGFGHRGNLQQALAGVTERDFKILLSHDPTHWDAEVRSDPAFVQLTLSGHTHGMQFGIELFGFRWSPVQYRYRNWAGLVHEAGRYLYINRGFGFIGFSGRVGIWPEITILELRRNNVAAPDGKSSGG